MKQDLSSFLGKTVKFLPEVLKNEIDFEPGMVAEVVGGIEQEDDVWRLVMDFSKWQNYNLKFETVGYFDNSGKPTLKWSETSYFPKNCREEIYVGVEDKPIFEVLDESSLSPSTRWEVARAEILQKIKEIDDATPWQEREPRWWLQMMSVQNAALTTEE